MQTLVVKSKTKLLFFLTLSLFLLTHTRSNAQIRVHTYLDGIEAPDFIDVGLGIDIEKQFDVDYSVSIGLGYRNHANWKNDDYAVDWDLLEIPVGFKYYIHPALGVQLLVAPRFIISSASGMDIGSWHDVGVHTTPLFNTNVGLMVTTGGSFLGLFPLPKMASIGVGLRYNILPQSITINDPDAGVHSLKEQAVGFDIKMGITLFSLKRKKL